ncbi:hypothetical protein [Cupriavidus malaysiensis]|uniref:Uncharacterized protein n=1 Tax=Cupriavidus malaysiensis TaxID=367825 RepID=A0ABM6F395_9BURK|nr:hypothetical protein [Cupriavidus malaysiensis]AOZ05899.1 hypothetical protein BKK80_08745 [Cupriavidus malaysiensis]
MNATFNFADDLKIEVLDAGSLENYVLNDDGIETIDGEFTFYTLAVQAFGRTFNVRTQQEPNGHLIVPSSENTGEPDTDAIMACSEYFALFQALIQKHLGIEFTEEDHENNEWVLPENIQALHDAVVAHLKAVLTEEIAATA